jgi:hypothetical protein
MSLFAVVRNPYECFLSEFYCPYEGFTRRRIDRTSTNHGTEGPTAPEGSNQRSQTPIISISSKWIVSKRCPDRNLHMSHNQVLCNDQGVHFVEHRLKLEQLPDQFTELMAPCDLHVYLNVTVNQRKK